jgi:hypothetical protein
MTKQEKIIKFEEEIIEWLYNECPPTFPPLEPMATADLSYDFAVKLVEKLNDLTYLKHQLQSEPESKDELYLNMQYYMEYCRSNGYITPQDWIEKFKHFKTRKSS